MYLPCHFEGEGTEKKTCLGSSQGVGMGLKLDFIITLQTTLLQLNKK